MTGRLSPKWLPTHSNWCYKPSWMDSFTHMKKSAHGETPLFFMLSVLFMLMYRSHHNMLGCKILAAYFLINNLILNLYTGYFTHFEKYAVSIRSSINFLHVCIQFSQLKKLPNLHDTWSWKLLQIFLNPSSKILFLGYLCYTISLITCPYFHTTLFCL